MRERSSNRELVAQNAREIWCAEPNALKTLLGHRPSLIGIAEGKVRRVIWCTSLVPLWTSIIGFACIATSLIAQETQIEPEEETGFGMFGGLFLVVFILLPITCVWLCSFGVQVRQVNRMRGHRCKESDALELAIKAQILFAIGAIIFSSSSWSLCF
jgi:hypothetical protein